MSFTIIDEGDKFKAFLSFDAFFARNLNAIKNLPPGTRQYVVDQHTQKNYWLISNAERRTVLGWKSTLSAIILKPEEVLPEVVGEVPDMRELDIALPWNEGIRPRPYQKQGIAQSVFFKKVLNGDEQGLGKTMQSIGTLLALEVKGLSAFPALVIAPASTKQNWKREIEKFSNKKALVLDSKLPAKVKKDWFSYVRQGIVQIVIINYESLSSFLIESYPEGKLSSGRSKSWKASDVQLKSFMSVFRSGILDESHRCKDPRTRQTKFVLRIFHGFEYRILLSGTPVINRPIDLYPQLAIMGTLNSVFGGKDKFIARYCDGGAGRSNLKELNYKLQLNCFFRREKKTVAKDLPDKSRQTIICDLSNRAEYNSCEADFEKYLRSSGALDDEQIRKKMQGEIIVQMMKLKAIAAKGKMNEVREFVEEVIESGEKIILFCSLHEIVDECKRLWPEAVTITGRDDMQKRQIHIDKFQGCKICGVNLQDHAGKDHEHVLSDTQIIICNHKAAGVGITLTTSSRVAFIEYPWTAADCVQCEDRAHRIGQKNNVTCTYFLGQETIDERMWQIILEKMDVANAITGATDQMQTDMLDKTLNLFSSKNK